MLLEVGAGGLCSATVTLWYVRMGLEFCQNKAASLPLFNTFRDTAGIGHSVVAWQE